MVLLQVKSYNSSPIHLFITKRNTDIVNVYAECVERIGEEDQKVWHDLDKYKCANELKISGNCIKMDEKDTDNRYARENVFRADINLYHNSNRNTTYCHA